MIKILIIDDNPQKMSQVRDAIMAGYDIPDDMIDMAYCQSEGRDKMSQTAYDIVILDLVLPFGVDDEPEQDGGIKYLRLIEQNSKTKLPLQVIGLTEYEEEYYSNKEDFNKFLFQLVLWKQGDTAWRDDLLRAVGFVSRSKAAMLDTIQERNKYDILVLCALREEFRELQNAFGADSWKRVKVSEKDIVAYETYIESAYIKTYRVLAYCIDKPGVAATATMASYLINSCSPKCVFMTGITGGIKRDGLKLGDVVIAESILDYTTGKIQEYQNEIKLLREIHQIPASSMLLSQISDYLSNVNTEAVMNTNIRKNHLQHGEENYRIHKAPTICGPFVMASESVVDQLKQDDRKLAAIDMEGFGLMTVSHFLQIPVLWIKGISDMAGSNKDDNYHTTASFASAALLHGFIKEGLDV